MGSSGRGISRLEVRTRLSNSTNLPPAHHRMTEEQPQRQARNKFRSGRPGTRSLLLLKSHPVLFVVMNWLGLALKSRHKARLI